MGAARASRRDAQMAWANDSSAYALSTRRSPAIAMPSGLHLMEADDVAASILEGSDHGRPHIRRLRPEEDAHRGKPLAVRKGSKSSSRPKFDESGPQRRLKAELRGHMLAAALCPPCDISEQRISRERDKPRPSFTNSLAVARPIPPLPPVTSAIFPSSFLMHVSSSDRAHLAPQRVVRATADRAVPDRS
jgi:hypothetical protein